MGKHLCQSLFFNKAANLRPATLLKRECFSVNFAKIFKNMFCAEHLQVTASDIRMQVAVIYNLNLSLQFVTINFKFSLQRVFTLAHALHNAPELLRQFAFR